MTRQDQVSEWMAAYGGTPSQCAECLGISYNAVQRAWQMVCARYGWQAR